MDEAISFLLLLITWGTPFPWMCLCVVVWFQLHVPGLSCENPSFFALRLLIGDGGLVINMGLPWILNDFLQSILICERESKRLPAPPY